MNVRCRHHWFRILTILCLSAVLGSCSMARDRIVGETVAVMVDGQPAFEGESDLALMEAAFPASIKLLETLGVNRPEDEQLLILLSRIYAGYAYSIFEGQLEAEMLGDNPMKTEGGRAAAIRTRLNRYYLRGADYALGALSVRHPECREKLAKVSTIQPFLNELKPADVPALFWYAFNLGAWVNQNRDSIAAVAKAHWVEKTAGRVIELDEGFYHGSAHLLLLAYEASRSPMMGGKPEKALPHYRRLLSIAGEDFLLADVYYARYYLPHTQERGKYEERLRRVIGKQPKNDPYPFLNAIARERAAIYLDAANRLFQ